MLLIWDIHINSIYKEKIISSLRDFVDKNSEEKNIIFVGDFVYHFSYDRVSLLALYDFFLELFFAGKQVYVLAGNHDWLGNTFVFEEGKKAFEIVKKISLQDVLSKHPHGKIQFITEPVVENIEGEQILFLPYMLDMPQLPAVATSHPLSPLIALLEKSTTKWEQKSAALQRVMIDYMQQYPNLTVIHHYYTNGVKFPGQQSQFSYRDVALSERFLDQPGLQLISWHLHQPFVYKNYLCVWSVRYTTPLEVNQIKWLFVRKGQEVDFVPLMINPYVFLEPREDFAFDYPVEESVVQNFLHHLLHEQQKLCKSDIWNVTVSEIATIDLKQVSFSLKVSEIDYEHVERYISPELHQHSKDIKLKKESVTLDQMIGDMDIAHKNLSTNFADWKSLLSMYLQKKYPQDVAKYEERMEKLKLV